MKESTRLRLEAQRYEDRGWEDSARALHILADDAEREERLFTILRWLVYTVAIVYASVAYLAR